MRTRRNTGWTSGRRAAEGLMRLMVPGRRRWLTPPVPKVLLWGLWATGHLQNFRFKGAVLQGSVPGRPATALGFLKQLLCDSVSETSMQDDQTLAKIMDEAIQTRKNLDKLVAKLKKDKGNQATLCCINAYPSRGSPNWDRFTTILRESRPRLK